jgi:2-amino-4-hydroxy-6-hydroxymethyldihydropteridine diphosphokinase
MKHTLKDRHVIIAFGANQPSPAGRPDQTILAAIAALSGKNISIQCVSRLFATPAFPSGSGPDYVNVAISATTAMSERELLNILHETEANFSRFRNERWQARTLDIDLIAVEDAVHPDRLVLQRWMNMPLEDQKRLTPEELILPHPRLQDRAFVLVPMAEVAPSWRHPLTGKSVTEMLASLDPALKAEVRPL